MNVTTERKEDHLHVHVEVSARKRDEKMRIYTTNIILEWLKKNAPQYNLEKAKLVKKPTVHNGLGPKYLSGEWIFELNNKGARKPEPLAETVTPAPVKPALVKRKTKRTPTKTKSEV